MRLVEAEPDVGSRPEFVQNFMPIRVAWPRYVPPARQRQASRRSLREQNLIVC